MSVGNSGREVELATFGELRLLDKLRAMLSAPESGAAAKSEVIEGIGDDTAVLRWQQGADLLLLTCDALVENVHFRKGTPADRIGWKAMGCNLSDIAAMGGIPLYALVSLGCPAATKVAEIESLYGGMKELADRYGASIVGGDTIESPTAMVVTVVLAGKVEEDRYVSRHGARPGDVLCVTGSLGGSLLGKHLAFTPRVKEGRYLATHCSPTAMIDVSDGLASDLLKILQTSGVTAEIDAEKIPISEAARNLANQRRQSPLSSALYDGEDFELLFTLPQEIADASMAEFRKHFSTSVEAIGRIKRGRGKPVVIQSDGTTTPLKAQGYEHFTKGDSRPPEKHRG